MRRLITFQLVALLCALVVLADLEQTHRAVLEPSPPALKAIIAVDATDDLYQDDVHFMDGMMIPRRMIFWHAMNTIAVGIDAMTNPAMETHGSMRVLI